ncbi:MAG TPA: ABC transporter permease [Roseiflexaceae bacterium]|nr:ABC transporter permease [Roseiflexaceae bacterium]
MSTIVPQAEKASRANTLRRWAGEQRVLLIAYSCIFVLLAFAGILSPGFVQPGNLSQQLVLASFLGVIAAGQTIVILTGGIDLSVSWTLNFAAVLLTRITDTGFTFPSPGLVLYGCAVALLFGVAVGFVNGLGIAYLRIPPLVMTLGMNVFLQGAVLVYTNGTPQGAAPPLVQFLAVGKLFGVVPVAVIVWAVVSTLVIVLLRRTVLGRQIYAVGNNPVAAYLSGVHPRRVLVSAYVISGLCAAFAGILLTGFSSQSYLGMGEAYVLASVAAVVIGGTSILGGSGGYGGTIAGAVIVVLLQSTLAIAQVPEAGRNILYGLIILIMLFVYGRGKKISD